MEYVYSLEELPTKAKEILAHIVAHKNTTRATVVFLSGEIGAGKTTLTKEFGKLLGVHDTIASPTFVIMKFYQTKHKAFSELIHIDAYRLERKKELEVLGFETILQNQNTLILIEWPELIPGIVEYADVVISIVHRGDHERVLQIA